MTQTQEEMLLIGAFALFWLGQSSPNSYTEYSDSIFAAVLVALRAIGERGELVQQSGAIAPARATRTGSPARRQQNPIASRASGWPCSRDAFQCVIEEWTYL